MYAQVVVLTYQSADIESYTYKIPKELENEIKVGQLVQVQFGKRSPMGIVISTNYQLPTTNYQIKPISSVILSQPILLPYQIKLLKWMSFYHVAPMVNCLEAMLPQIPRRSIIVDGSSEKKIISFTKIPMNDKQLTIPQTLVLVPTINHIPLTLAKFPKARNYAVYHNELKKSEKIATWFKILSGKIDYIFGSRSAIFAPCPNLSEIIIFDEHEEAFKDERSPYFGTLTVAQKISELTGCKIQIFDSSPKITTYFNYQTHPQGVQMTTEVHPGGERKGIRTKLISMQEEKLAGNFSPISTYLQDQLKKNQNSLLFLNKKKESGSLFCKNCKFSDYFEKQPEMCPKCKSPEIYFNVLNIDSLSSEVKRLRRQSTIEIKTATIFYTPQIQKYDLVAYIQPDSLLSRTDFSNVETLYSQIANLKKLLKKNGLLVIQTYNAEDETLRMVAYSNYPLFFKDQLEKRKLLSYPPFALLVKLVIKGKNEDKVAKSAHQLFSRLNSTIQQFNNSTISLLGPYQPLFFSKKPTFNIIIKYKLKNYDLKSREEANKNLSPILKEIAKKAQIVVEPESIN